MYPEATPASSTFIMVIVKKEKRAERANSIKWKTEITLCHRPYEVLDSKSRENTTENVEPFLSVYTRPV